TFRSPLFCLPCWFVSLWGLREGIGLTNVIDHRLVQLGMLLACRSKCENRILRVRAWGIRILRMPKGKNHWRALAGLSQGSGSKKTEGAEKRQRAPRSSTLA